MNELQRYAASQIVKSEGTVAEKASKGLIVTGGGGLLLYGVAGILPFISLPMLLVLMVIGGLVLAFKD